MTFITPSTITDPNPGPTLYAVIETAALAQGWTLDDTVVIGGNTHKILKSAAAGNTYGLDWWLDINFPTTGTTGGIRFAPFEGYTAASDVGLRGPYVANSTTIDATTYSRFGATTSALETNWANTAALTGLSLALTVSTFTYYISVTRDGICVGLSNVANAIAYTGFFTPSSAHTTQASTALFPLIMTVLTTGQTGSGSSSTAAVSAALTRAPKSTSLNWSTSVRVPVGDLLAAGYLGGRIGTGASDYSNLTNSLTLPVVMGDAGIGAISSSTPLAAYVGEIDRVRLGFVTAGVVRGDTVTIGSDTWYAATASASMTLFMKGI